MSTAARLDARGVSRRFGRHLAVDGVDLVAEEGRLIGVVGESGSGKSTLARLLTGLDRPTGGEIEFAGEPLGRTLGTTAGRRSFYRSVQFVMQDSTSSFDPRRSMRESLRQPAIRLLGLSRPQADERIDELVDHLGLPDGAADRSADEVSGGQRQRFALARGLIVRPRLLVCDEVVSALDVSVQGAVLNLIKQYCAQSGAGLVFVAHGLPATAFMADELVVMRDGRVVEHGQVHSVMLAPEHSYTRELLDAYRTDPGASATLAGPPLSTDPTTGIPLTTRSTR